MIEVRSIRNTLFAVIGILALAFGAYGAGFYYIKAQVEETSVLAQELEQKQVERNNLQETLRAVEETEQMRAQLNTYFVNAADVVSFIEQLESLGEETGVAVTISDLREETNGGLAFRLEAEGMTATVFHFTELLEHMPLNMTIEQVQLQQTSSARRQWRGVYTGTITSFLSRTES